MGWAQLATILGAIASVLTIMPIAMRLFVTPIIRRQIDDLEKNIGKRFDSQTRAVTRIERRLARHIERGGHERRE